MKPIAPFHNKIFLNGKILLAVQNIYPQEILK